MLNKTILKHSLLLFTNLFMKSDSLISLKNNLLICRFFILTAFCIQSNCYNSPITSTALSSDSVRIAYEVQGRGTPTLIFIHGGSCDHSYWNKQLPFFAQYYQVVSIDLPGHGESGTNRKNWTIEAFGADVVAVAKKLGLEKVILIGHSLGGPVILEAAKQMPERVVGLVGIDVFQTVDQKYPQEMIDRSVKRIRSNFKEAISKGVKGMFTSKSDPALVEKIVKDISSAPPEITVAVIEEDYKWLNDKYVQALQEVKAPIRCINSDMIPTDEEGVRRYVPSFKVRYMPGLGHFIMLEDPETFNRLLYETINELDGQEGE